MITLDTGDKIQGICSVAAVIDYTISGIIRNNAIQISDGQLPSTLSDLYTAPNKTEISSIILVNTDSSTRTVNLYLTPEGEAAQRLIPKDFILGIGYSLHYSGSDTNTKIFDTLGREISEIWNADIKDTIDKNNIQRTDIDANSDNIEINATNIINGDAGASYYFMTDDYVNVDDDADIDFGTGDFAIRMNNIIPANVTATEYLLNKETGGVGYGLYKVEDDLYIRFDDNTADASAIIGTAVFEVGVKSNIFVNFDRSGNATAFINGRIVGIVDISGSPLTLDNAGALRIGCTTAGASFFAGEIGEYKIFNQLYDETNATDLTIINGGEVPFKYIGASQTEKVSNGTIEADVSGWTYQAGDETATFTYNNTTPITGAGDGKLAVTIVGTSNSRPRLYPSMITAVEIGKKYRLTFKTKVNSGTVIITSAYIGGQTFNDDIILSGTETTTIEMTVPATDAIPPNIYFDGTNVFEVQIDDFSLVQIGCVANYSSESIGHNTWSDVNGNNLFGTVSGASAINMKYQQNVVRQDGITADTQILSSSNIIPAGYMLKYMYGLETAGNTATLDLGTTAGASDVFSQQVFTASTETTVVINKLFSRTTDTALYLNDDGAGTWNSGSLNVILVLERVE